MELGSNPEREKPVGKDGKPMDFGKKQALAKSQRLMTGARSEVQLPRGGTTHERSIHVMDFMKSLTDIYSQAEDTYDCLYESCHPNYLRLTT